MYTFSQCIGEYLILKAERSEWDIEWMSISDYLIPGRGLYDELSIPRKRKLTSPKAINQTARDALRVLTSGIQGGIIPSTRPWLEMSWKAKELNKITFFKEWLTTVQEILVADFSDSNFYTENTKAITEICAFGNGAIFTNSDIEEESFSSHNIPTGSYVFATDSLGRIKKIHRIMVDSPQNLVTKYGDKVSQSTKDFAKNKMSNRDYKFILILESIVPEKYMDKTYKRYVWEVGAAGLASNQYTASDSDQKEPLMVDGFYEFPVSLGRWDVLGNDDFGIGPGSEALPEIKRLQEVEKAIRLATHKDIDPPLWAPSYMSGLLKTLPGSRNFYRNPNDKVDTIYRNTFKHESAELLINRIEEGIKRKFFNDIFLTSARDPNASPLKAAEVVMRDGEKLLRLGSVMESIIPEFINPQVMRCFNIALRKGRFPPIPPEYQQMIQESGDIQITLTSPLAQAQKLVSAKAIEVSLAFIGQAQTITPRVLDKVNIDAAIDEYFDAHGTPKRVLNSEEQVQAIREQEAQKAAREEKQKEALVQAEIASKVAPAQMQDANAAKTRAETGQILTDSLQTQQELGGVM